MSGSVKTIFEFDVFHWYDTLKDAHDHCM